MLEERRRGGSLGWREASSLSSCSVPHCSEPPGSCLEGGPVRSAKGPGCYNMTEARTLGKWSEIIFSSEGKMEVPGMWGLGWCQAGVRAS